MGFLLGLLLGAVVGVIAERALGYPIDKYLIEPFLRTKERQRALEFDAQHSVQGELLKVGESAVFIDQFFPNGIDLPNLFGQMDTHATTIRSRLDESPVCRDLIDAGEVEAGIDRWKILLADDPNGWNGDSIALSRLEVSRVPTDEYPVVSLWFRNEDYATARAVEDAWERISIDQRRSMDGATLRTVDPFLSNAFGLNCTVESASGELLIAKRGPHARGWSGYWHTSCNEGTSVNDVDSAGEVDLLRAYARGLKEELGLDAKEIPEFERRLRIHGLILDVDRYQWGMVAHLDLRKTKYTSNEIRGMRNVGAAHDDWEASDIRFIDFSSGVDAVLAEIADSSHWVPHGLINVALSAIARHPGRARRVREALMLGGGA